MTDRGLVALARGSVLTVGTFDGVHLGHRAILDDLKRCADRHQLPAAIVTFAPHPLAIVNPAAAPKLLTPAEERLVALADAASSTRVVIIPFSRALAAVSAEHFVQQLVSRYAMRELVVGYDHGLGRGRHGDVDVLRELGATLRFGVEVVSAQMDSHGRAISSTAIRRAVAYGDLDAARAMLGRPYELSGVVVRGMNRGRDIGVPTINIAIAPEKLLPPDGVYAVRVSASKGIYGGMMNLGPRPTFGETERVPEVHMFDAGGDWYGDTVCVELVKRLRDTVRFAGVTELQHQLSRDAQSARLALTQA